MTVLFNNREVEIDKNYTVLEFLKKQNADLKKVLAVKANNEFCGIDYRVNDGDKLKTVELTSEEGYKIYRHSLIFIFITSALKVYPGCKLDIKQSVGKSTYCQILNTPDEPGVVLENIKAQMDEIINKNIIFEVKEFSKEEAAKILNGQGQAELARNILEYPKNTIKMCKVNEAGYHPVFDRLCIFSSSVSEYTLTEYEEWILLSYPSNYENIKNVSLASKRLIETLFSYRSWGDFLGLGNVKDLNRAIRAGKANEVVNLAERLHEQRISEIVLNIKRNLSDLKVILISGPSSSGKTTFGKRLNLALKVMGVIPITISLDDYYHTKEQIPLDDEGNYDFESVEAIDYQLFNKHLTKLINGEEVYLPHYDFQTGVKTHNAQKVRLMRNQVLIVEGIHALNNKLTFSIPQKNKYKIYCTPLTALSFDEYNSISPSDTRLLRRIVRDFEFRNTDALGTLKMWPSVRRGERSNIFPYEETADEIFNSSLIYEFCALKNLGEMLLKKVGKDAEEYTQAQRLLELLSYFLPIDLDLIPKTSIIREFIGGSTL